jgi:hypothetical protein
LKLECCDKMANRNTRHGRRALVFDTVAGLQRKTKGPNPRGLAGPTSLSIAEDRLAAQSPNGCGFHDFDTIYSFVVVVDTQ